MRVWLKVASSAIQDHCRSFAPHSFTMPDKGRAHFSVCTLANRCLVPAYVSARSADEILSTIRPTKIKTDSLRSLNIFLDELLWLVLHSARSLATNRLKAGLLHILPSALGKDAILEAEVELRTYKMRSPTPVMDEPGVKQTDFPLQPTFEVCSHCFWRPLLIYYSCYVKNARHTAHLAT